MSRIPLRLLGVPVALLLLAGNVVAKDYQIEVVMFENRGVTNTTGVPSLYLPRVPRAFRLNSEKAQEAGFSVIEEGLSMGDYVETIRNSRNYRLLRHFAWRQPGLAAKDAQAIRINVGKGLKMFIPTEYQKYKEFIPATTSALGTGESREITTTTVNGSLKVRLGRFLHLDSRLVFTDDKTAVSYRLDHSRKMRSRELHYIDNPRFGMLVRILPVEE